MKDQSSKQQYRYPGVTPFTTKQSHIFFGREQEIQQLHQLIRRQPLVVLYGKSGLGKSSLINAGLIPKILEDEVYAPVVIRFGAWTANTDASPIGITKDLLKEGFEKETFLSKLIPGDDSLWFRAKNRQLNGGGKPILIFDQFEELFSYPNIEIAGFQQEIAELLHSSIPLRFRRKLESSTDLSDEDEDRLETPLDARILFAIRSDRLHLMDRLKDYLPNILRHTYDLKALRVEDAKTAITLPAQMEGDFQTPPFRYTDEALGKLVDFLKEEEASKEKEPRVEGILIQMLCEHYERNQVEKEGLLSLGISQIGDPNKVVLNYYDEKIKDLPADNRLAARRLIEDGLVSEGEGMRLSLHEAFIFQEYQVTKRLLEKLVDNRLLRSEPFLRGGYTYELSHDRLVPAVIDARTIRRAAEAEKERQAEALRLKKQAEQERKEKEKAKRQLRTVRGLLVFAIIALLSAVAGLLYANNQRSVAEKSEKESLRLFKENQRKDSLNRVERLNRYLAEAKSLQDQGIYDQAIDKYEFAKEFTEDTIAINETIAACRQAAGNRERFDELMQEAQRLTSASNYNRAIQGYQEASELQVDPSALRLELNKLKGILEDEATKAKRSADALSYDKKAADNYQAQERRYRQYISQIDNLLRGI